MPMYDRDGNVVDLLKLPSWEQRGDRVHVDHGVFMFFRCNCTDMHPRGLKRRPHRMGDCERLFPNRLPPAPPRFIRPAVERQQPSAAAPTPKTEADPKAWRSAPWAKGAGT